MTRSVTVTEVDYLTQNDYGLAATPLPFEPKMVRSFPGDDQFFTNAPEIAGSSPGDDPFLKMHD
jgi:hypothetical protein